MNSLAYWHENVNLWSSRLFRISDGQRYWFAGSNRLILWMDLVRVYCMVVSATTYNQFITSKSGWAIIPEVRLFLARWLLDLVFTNRTMMNQFRSLRHCAYIVLGNMFCTVHDIQLYEYFILVRHEKAQHEQTVLFVINSWWITNSAGRLL
jgi:hypothetical protein